MDPKALEKRFNCPLPLRDEYMEIYIEIREAGLQLARIINSSASESHEKDVALNQVDAAIMWAIAAIARSNS